MERGVLARRIFPVDPTRSATAAHYRFGHGRVPLTNEEAWGVYDSFLADSRVRMFPELAVVDECFRAFSSMPRLHPKFGWMPIWRPMLPLTKPSW